MARLNIAMLSQQEEQVEGLAQNHIEVLGQQVEDDMLQLQQQEEESRQVDSAVEDALQAAEDLVEEQQATEELLERKEEVTQAALESIHRNVKNILKNIGMEANQVSTYRYKTDEEKAAAKASEEDTKKTSTTIGEYIKKIWQAIKEAWFRIVDAIKGFFKNLFNASIGVKKRALAIKEEAKKAKGKTVAADAKLEAPQSAVTNMRMNYKAIPPDGLARGLSKQNDTLNMFIKNLTSPQALSVYEKHNEEVVKLIMDRLSKKGKTPSEQEEKEFAKATGESAAEMLKPVMVYFPQVSSDGKFGTPAFISDRVLAIEPKTSTVSIEKIDGYKELEVEYGILSPFQIEETCDVVAKQMDEYKNLDKAAEDFKKFSKEIEKVQYDLMDEKKDVGFFDRKIQATIAARVTRFFMNIVKTVATQTRVLDLQVNKAAIDWCAASMKLYK